MFQCTPFKGVGFKELRRGGGGEPTVYTLFQLLDFVWYFSKRKNRRRVGKVFYPSFSFVGRIELARGVSTMVLFNVMSLSRVEDRP